MKRFIYRLGIFVIVFACISISLVFTVSRLVANGNHFSLPAPCRYLIMGNSHANCSFNDTLINGSVNCAQGGEPYLFTYLKTKKLVETNPQIRLVFIEFSNNQISTRADKWTWQDSALTNYYPLYAPFIDLYDLELLCKKNIKCVATVQPVSLRKNITYIFENKNFIANGRWGGYKNYKGTVVDSLFPNQVPQWNVQYDKSDTVISEVNINYLLKTIGFLRKRYIPVFLLRSPVHPRHTYLKNEPKFLQILAAHFSDVPFIDFVDFPLYNNEYGDFEHLNYRGAKTFSVFFNRLLKEGLLTKENRQAFINASMQLVRKERIPAASGN